MSQPSYQFIKKLLVSLCAWYISALEEDTVHVQSVCVCVCVLNERERERERERELRRETMFKCVVLCVVCACVRACSQ